MKQLSNKIIFVFLLAVGLSFTLSCKASGHVVLSYAILEDESDVNVGTSGTTTTTTPPVVPISKISLNYNLNKEVTGNKYSPGESIIATVNATSHTCSNAVLGVKISGYIKSQGSDTSKNIIDNTSIQGSYSLEGNGIYTAPDNEGEDAFVGTLSVYKANNSYLKYVQTVYNTNITDVQYLSSGAQIYLYGVTYIFKGDHFIEYGTTNEIPISQVFHDIDRSGIISTSFSEGGLNHTISYYPVEITNVLDATPYTFEIPFTVVAPTPKSITVEVYKNGMKVNQGADKVISQAVQSGTELLITYTPSGLSFPFTCYEPPVSSEYPNGYPRVFSSQADVLNTLMNPGFKVTPSKTTNYSVTCSN